MLQIKRSSKLFPDVVFVFIDVLVDCKSLLEVFEVQ